MAKKRNENKPRHPERSEGSSMEDSSAFGLRMTMLIIIIFILFPVFSSAEEVKKEEWFKLGAEGRYRIEYRSDFDFNGSSDAFHLTRFRLNGEVRPFENLRLFAQAQDSRIFESDFKGEAARALFENRFDLRQGYAELNRFLVDPLNFIVGRQELVYGEERLVGAFNWGNVAQTFDALRLVHETDAARVDLFASQKVETRDDHFDERDHKDNFYGLYATWKKIKKHVLDLYTFLRDTEDRRLFSRAEAPAQIDEVTVGSRLKGTELNGWDYSVELAGQAGNFGDGEIHAFALISQVGYTLQACPWKPRLSVEFAHASGDDDPGDGDRGTFDNLFPTNHYFYGYADQVSLQNINDIKFGVDLKPAKKLTFSTSLHLFYLDEEEDALYNAARRPVRFDPTGNASSTVGQELDILAKYYFTDHGWVESGYSHFFTGGFIEETGPSRDLDFFYALISFKY